MFYCQETQESGSQTITQHQKHLCITMQQPCNYAPNDQILLTLCQRGAAYDFFQDVH